MSINKQVCSLEHAKRLKELGVKQDSYFYHYEADNIWWIDHFSQPWGSHISAFTASELGEMLPNGIFLKNSEPFDNYRIFITKFYSVGENMIPINNFIVNYECDSTEMDGEKAWLRRKLTSNIYDPNLANAMAKMLIYLLENGLIKND